MGKKLYKLEKIWIRGENRKENNSMGWAQGPILEEWENGWKWNKPWENLYIVQWKLINII